MKSPVLKKQELMSDMYSQLEELEINLKNNDIDISKSFGKYKSYVKKIPKLIRKNGLILTLSFLNKKSGGKSEIRTQLKILEKDSGLYAHIIQVYLNYFNKDCSIDDDLKGVFKYFLGISDDYKEVLNKIKFAKEEKEINEILHKESDKRILKVNSNSKKYREISIKTINFFDTYSIIVDGFASGYND